jgi:uncharacterized protein (DUF1015 family)
MVEISPFLAIRYTTKDVAPLIAPPYDVIDEAQREQLYAKHPHNIVRIDFTKPESGDHALARYERAASHLAEWQKSGVLATDPTPGIYVLAQTFTGPDGVQRTRTGFFSRVRLMRFDEGGVLPHERTLRGPKIDRLELFRATRTNLSPIFGAYRDPEQRVQGLLQRATSKDPIAEGTMSGTHNRLWRVDDADTVAAIVRAMADRKLYIADGHHRYETGLAYRDERRQAAGGAVRPEAGYEHILFFASAVEDPGMVIFPTHRLAHSLPSFDEKELVRTLSSYFSVMDAPEEPKAAQAALEAAGRGGPAYLLATKSARRLLRLRSSGSWVDMPPLPMAPALRFLDVSVLHTVILEHALGISKEAQETQANLRYSKDFAEALASPSGNTGVQAALLMNPTKMEEVIRVAESGEVMPQKSTFFYPKIPSGLVLYPLD